jgi:hypothetical protein
MNLICIVVVLFAVETWGAAMFSLRTQPAWASDASNETMMTAGCARV